MFSRLMLIQFQLAWDTKTDRWSAHTARITSIQWNAAGTHAVSGSLDCYIYVWSLKSPGKRVKAAIAHKDGCSGVYWIDGDKKLASAGGDASLKIWVSTCPKICLILNNRAQFIRPELDMAHL